MPYAETLDQRWALLLLSVGTEAFWRAVLPLGHMHLFFLP
jgi:hypothetical protein